MTCPAIPNGASPNGHLFHSAIRRGSIGGRLRDQGLSASRLVPCRKCSRMIAAGREAPYAVQKQPNFPEYLGADSLPLELGQDSHTTQHPDSFLACNPHYAYKIISAPRAHDNIAELYLARVTREPVKLPNTVKFTPRDN